MTQNRSALFASLEDRFDVLVIGGGATGLGIAVDAATRGYRTALVEAGDFAQATSSRATKLAHGGVRYLATGQIHLVREALRERATMLRAAPHLARPLEFVLPVYRRWQLPYYGAGLKLYDRMAGRATLGPTRMLGAQGAAELVPGLARAGLRGGVAYWDAQFNDARLALALARTASDHGAVVVNYAGCEGLLYESGRVAGAEVRDVETGAASTVRAKTVINAAGIFSDEVRRMDEAQAAPTLALSRGTHIVVRAEALGGKSAMIVPKTPDGRVIFAVPWEGRIVIGTTDVPVARAAMEPGHTGGEIDYLLETVARYLERPVEHGDIVAVYSGLRPLVSGKGAATSRLSREHAIRASASGLISVTGGKWTTYRKMAEDALDFATAQKMLTAAPCRTESLRLHGATEGNKADGGNLAEYGSDAAEVRALMTENADLAERMDPEMPYTMAQAVHAVRAEWARTVEDVLSRRTRALLVDARAAVRAAPRVAKIVARELGRDEDWAAAQARAFAELARRYYLPE
ncbi:MAG TPA: glycerol-3-phosphate dehydrogenase/oxidase [Acidobacteriaceae bacterium]|nr:glycerol-3-phosphate dehydrogenase/oxidase [Acidobacteriaceae bacterium]